MYRDSLVESKQQSAGFIKHQSTQQLLFIRRMVSNNSNRHAAEVNTMRKGVDDVSLCCADEWNYGGKKHLHMQVFSVRIPMRWFGETESKWVRERERGGSPQEEEAGWVWYSMLSGSRKGWEGTGEDKPTTANFMAHFWTVTHLICALCLCVTAKSYGIL